jgi:hypothetical protein
MVKKIAVIIFIALIIIQFFHPKKNLAERTPQHIEHVYPMRNDVKAILIKACYDCHSDSTRYPWYNKIQPVAWWLAHHVDEGKAELNFSEFGSYSKKKKDHKLEEVVEMVGEGHMPLDSYTWLHSDAKLKKAEVDLLIDWAETLREQIATEQ